MTKTKLKTFEKAFNKSFKVLSTSPNPLLHDLLTKKSSHVLYMKYRKTLIIWY